MAFLILDDGYPDSEEYNNNYIYFDEKNPQSFRRALDLLKRYSSEKMKENFSPKLKMKNSSQIS